MRIRFFVILGACFSGLAASPAAAAPGIPTELTVVARTENAALLEWRPGSGTARGFKVRPSSSPGVHPNPVLFPGGKLAAFTWSTDDGYDDNLLYEPIFSSRGLHFTAFIIPGQLGVPGYLTWSDVEALHAAGHEIANHTYHHAALIDDRAIALRYLGAEPCSLAVSGGHLRTWVAGTPDLDILLTAPGTYFLATLSSYLDANPDYEAVRLAAPDTIYATYAQFLVPVSGRQIGAGAPAETLTTARGVHDDAEMVDELESARIALETDLQVQDPAYRCRTVAYPNHAHAQWAMSTLNELGYLGARSGPPGVWPYYSQGAFKIGFNTTYEVAHSSPRTNNAWSEAQTRTTVQNRVNAWKTNHEWAVLMSHQESEVDVAHLEWTIDTIASNPDVWIARFDEVMAYLSSYYVDVGTPVDPQTGLCRAWITGMDPGQSSWVVVTAYDAALSESGWSAEVFVPPYSSSTGAVATAAASPFGSARAFPDPFAGQTSIQFRKARRGSTVVNFFDVNGRRVDTRDLGPLEAGAQSFTWDARSADHRALPTGVYWYRIEDTDAEGGIAVPGSAPSGRVHVVR